MVGEKWTVGKEGDWYVREDVFCDMVEAAENLVIRWNSPNWNKPDTEMYIKALEAAVCRAKGE